VLGEALAGVAQYQLAGHAQVDGEHQVFVKVEQQVLAAALEPVDGPAGQRGGEVVQRRVAADDPGRVGDVPDLGGCDLSAGHLLQEVPADHLYLR
jgi:hypothetical protein